MSNSNIYISPQFAAIQPCISGHIYCRHEMLLRIHNAIKCLTLAPVFQILDICVAALAIPRFLQTLKFEAFAVE